MAGGVERDIQCGADFARLAELGCFDEEFVLYGCAFVQGQQVWYLLSADQKKMMQFYAKSCHYGCYPAPLRQEIKRCMVASGQREDVKQRLKLDLARGLRQTYPPVFFRELARLAQEAAGNQAYPLLEIQRQRLEGCFRAEETMLFAGLCQLALESKVLTEAAYQEFAAWLQYVRQQMADDILPRDKFERTFSGYAYAKVSGQIGYFYDAKETNVLERRAHDQQKGILTTPILTHSYSFSSLDQLPAMRQAFAALLQEKINASYFALVQEIKRLPANIAQAHYMQAERVIKAQCGPEALQALRMYGCRWNLLS